MGAIFPPLREITPIKKMECGNGLFKDCMTQQGLYPSPVQLKMIIF
jgi:hypothetical protein